MTWVPFGFPEHHLDGFASNPPTNCRNSTMRQSFGIAAMWQPPRLQIAPCALRWRAWADILTDDEVR
jgi:hypothetical protein